MARPSSFGLWSSDSAHLPPHGNAMYARQHHARRKWVLSSIPWRRDLSQRSFGSQFDVLVAACASLGRCGLFGGRGERLGGAYT